MHTTTAQPLRVWRAIRDITQLKLASRATTYLPHGLTMHQSRYCHIENGEGREPSIDEMKAIAKALRVKVADIAWEQMPEAKAS